MIDIMHASELAAVDAEAIALARAGRDLDVEPIEDRYDGASVWSWSTGAGAVWRHERGPDGQDWGNTRLADIEP